MTELIVWVLVLLAIMLILYIGMKRKKFVFFVGVACLALLLGSMYLGGSKDNSYLANAANKTNDGDKQYENITITDQFFMDILKQIKIDSLDITNGKKNEIEFELDSDTIFQSD